MRSKELIYLDIELTKKSNLQVDLNKVCTINGGLTIPSSVNAKTYDGEYVVIPTFKTKTLETKQKLMKENVTVEKIPVFKAENLGGGYTVVIGGND